jgi:parallel beta-helix repeat protein
MNEQRSFERFVADSVAGNVQGIPLPDDFYDEMHSFATTNGQRPEWLALIKEPPMRTNSRTTVGSPTVRVVSILAATLLLIVAMAAAGAGLNRLLAADGEIIVDGSGDGDYTTITEAVAAAADGDAILVKPGTYAESFTVDKSLSIRGEDREAVILTAAPEDYIPLSAEEEPELLEEEDDGFYTVTGGPFGVTVQAEAVRLESLTLQDNGVRVRSGSAAVTAVDATEVEVRDSGAATLTDVDVDWILSMAPGSSTTVSDSRLCLVDVSNDAVIEESTIGEGCEELPDKPDNEVTLLGGVLIWEGSTASLLDNDLVVPVDVRGGAAPTIEGNTIVDAGTAVRLVEAGGTTVRGNTLTDNRVAILMPGGQDTANEVLLEGNTITGGRTGIALTGGSSLVSGNTIEQIEGRAVAIGSEASAVLRDNAFCDNREDLFVDDEALVDIDDSNQVCGQPVTGFGTGIVVAQDGSGDFTTISEAIAAAADGDSIEVKAGTYVEGLRIDKDVELRGEDPETVVVESDGSGLAYADTFWDGSLPASLVIDQSDAVITNLTLRPRFSSTNLIMDAEGFQSSINGWSVVINGGAPRLENVRVTEGAGPVYIHGGSSATVRDSDFADQWIFVLERSPVTIERSSFEAVDASTGWDVANDSSSPVVVRESTFSGIVLDGSSGWELFRNTIVAPEWTEADMADGHTQAVGHGIDITGGDDWVVRGNDLVGFEGATAIDIKGAPTGSVMSNNIYGADLGISIEGGVIDVEDNVTEDGLIGVSLLGGEARIAHNQLGRNEQVGLGVLGSAFLSGNWICENGQDVQVLGDGTVEMDTTNEICDGSAG